MHVQLLHMNLVLTAVGTLKTSFSFRPLVSCLYLCGILPVCHPGVTTKTAMTGAPTPLNAESQIMAGLTTLKKSHTYPHPSHPSTSTLLHPFPLHGIRFPMHARHDLRPGCRKTLPGLSRRSWWADGKIATMSQWWIIYTWPSNIRFFAGTISSLHVPIEPKTPNLPIMPRAVTWLHFLCPDPQCWVDRPQFGPTYCQCVLWWAPHDCG